MRFFAALLAVSLVASGCFLFRKQPVEAPAPVISTIAPGTPIIGIGGLRLPSEQYGTTVLLSEINLESDGFLIIRDDLFGEPGVIVSASEKFSAGAYRDVALPVTVGQSDSATYYAQLYLDDGDGLFRQAEDSIAESETGEQVSVAFTLYASGTEIPDLEYIE